MPSKYARLDRFVSQKLHIKRQSVRLLLAQKRIHVDGIIAQSGQQRIGPFQHVCFDEQVLQQNSPYYIMLHKPIGVVSATQDAKHTTVIDIINHPEKQQLHIAGRLDFNSTGLLLLTNNGAWSKQISHPDTDTPKTYQVTLAKPITEQYIQAFEQGFYFSYEDIHTAPALLTILSPYRAEVVIKEGKYHQVKRMFGQLGNEVLSLHRSQIGQLILDPHLQAGQSRELGTKEIEMFKPVSKIAPQHPPQP